MSRMNLVRLSVAMVVAAAGFVLPALAEPEPYLRIRESDDGNVVELDVAARQFEPVDGTGPRVVLVGAAHIGDGVFYRRLQYLLDAQDVVLFEGVGIGDPNAPVPAADAEELAERAARRGRLIAAAVVGHKSRMGEYPATLDDLFDAMEPGTAAMLRPMIEEDGGVAVEYALERDEDGEATGFVVRAGGEEFGAGDLAVRAGEGPQSMAGEDGIQRVLARALGVKFQLDAMDYSQEHWVNCDVTMEELERLLVEAGLAGEGDNFLAMMAGGGMLAALQGPIVGMLGSNPAMRETVKLVLIDVLGQAEQMMEQMPGPMGELMDVLLHERNEHVIERLEAMTEGDEGVESIGVFYGAAHLEGIEAALVEMGYRPVATHWVTSMGVDMERAGVDAGQARMIRNMVRESIEQEARRMGIEAGQGK